MAGCEPESGRPMPHSRQRLVSNQLSFRHQCCNLEILPLAEHEDLSDAAGLVDSPAACLNFSCHEHRNLVGTVITPGILVQRKHQIVAAAAEDAIALVGCIAPAFLRVGRLGMNLIGNRFIEVKLGSKFVAHFGAWVSANLVMQVHGPSLIPTRIDGLKLDGTLPVCHLIPTQEFPPTRVAGAAGILANIRIRTERVAMSDVYSGSAQRSTGIVCDLKHVKRQTERYTGAD